MRRRRSQRSFNRRVAQRLGSCNSTPVSPNDPLRLRPDLFSPAVAFTRAAGGSHGSRGTAAGCEVDALRNWLWPPAPAEPGLDRPTCERNQNLEVADSSFQSRSRMNLQASAGQQQKSSGKRSRVHVKKSVRSHDPQVLTALS